ncbi:MAG: carbon starvation CstA family protein [Tepidisphaeraceae bacterium]
MFGRVWFGFCVSIAGAVQDFLALACSIRRDGRSLAQIAFIDVGKTAGTAATVAIILILVVALAGLGKVVVKALGGETVKFAPNTIVDFNTRSTNFLPSHTNEVDVYDVEPGVTLRWDSGRHSLHVQDGYKVRSSVPLIPGSDGTMKLPPDAVRLIPGSSWGVFTIAATIPIALFIGLWMYKVRPGHTIEASLIGGALVLGATVLGGTIKDSSFAHWFNLSQTQITWAMAVYGFVAAVLPVWVLLAPRDYLSSFLKIGTIALLVFGVIVANPKLEAPAINHVFLHGGPVLGPTASIFPFLFTTIMCGAISGFHALVSSGTTSKMLSRERDARTIGYGAMLIEGLVGVVALIAAASIGPRDFYAMNTDLAVAPQWQDKILQVGGAGGPEHITDYESLAQEPLRGRVGGAVTLAVGMAHIFDSAAARTSASIATVFHKLWPYWYHFAVMFEALFILTTIDAGTRIGRFLLQEVGGKLIHPKLGRQGWWPGAIVTTGLIVLGWAWFMNSDNFATIWKMFGIANQMLAVIALAVISSYLANSGRVRYVWVTVLPMLGVATTTLTAAAEMLAALTTAWQTQMHNPASAHRAQELFNIYVQGGAILLMVGCAFVVLAGSARRIWRAPRGMPIEQPEYAAQA